MNIKFQLPVFVLILMTGIVLAACGAAPAGAEVHVNPDEQSATVEFAGTVESIAADQWVIGGQTVLISAQTAIDSDIAAGDMVEVKATVALDGKATADRIELSNRAAGASGHGRSQNETSVSGDEMEFYGVVEAIADDRWTVSGQVFVVTAQTAIEGEIAVGDTVNVHASSDEGGILTASEIELDSETSQDDTGSSGVEMEFTGVVEAIGSDTVTINGRDFAVTAQTEIDGTLTVGDTVKVEAFGSLDGLLTAREIKLINQVDEPGPGSGSDDDDCADDCADDDCADDCGDDCGEGRRGAATERANGHGGAEPECTDDSDDRDGDD